MNPVRYHLRAFISPEHAKAQEKTLWNIIRKGRVDEVIFLVPHIEETSPGLGSEAECRRSAEVLRPLFSRLRKKHILPSINIWWTLGFKNYPGEARSQRDRYPSFRWAVSANGTVSQSIACPLDSAWLEEVKRVYRTFAELKPARLWLDDDVRAFLRADLKSPCFCDECLRRMGAQSRESLIQAVMADPPNPVREKWLDFENGKMVRIIGALCRVVHEKSPETHMGLMHGGLELLCAEGRQWKAVAKALGSPRPFFRPPVGCYAEGLGQEIALGFADTRIAQAVYSDKAIVAPEIENTPYSRFYKSARMTFAQMALCQLIGLNEITLHVHPSPFGRLDLNRENLFESMLGRGKPFLQAIADLNILPSQIRGVGLYFNEAVGRHVYGVSGADHPGAFARPRKWDAMLPLMGIATTYGQGSPVVLSAEQPLCMDREELKQALSRGPLLDGRAADAMVRAGMGEWIGIKARLDNARAVTEVAMDGRFGRKGEVISLYKEPSAWQFEWMSGARAISRLKSFGGEFAGHGVVLFENRWGSRIAVCPFDPLESPASQGMLSPSFICWARQAQLKAVLEWLGRKPLPLFVPDAPCVYPFLIEQQGRSIVGAVNLSTDPVSALKLMVSFPGKRIRRLGWLRPDGKWKEISAKISTVKGVFAIHTGIALNNLDMAVLKLEE